MGTKNSRLFNPGPLRDYRSIREAALAAKAAGTLKTTGQLPEGAYWVGHHGNVFEEYQVMFYIDNIRVDERGYRRGNLHYIDTPVDPQGYDEFVEQNWNTKEADPTYYSYFIPETENEWGEVHP